MYERCPQLGSVTVAVHCHDDLGLATANTLAGVAAGAGQIECTMNGLGERAGNAALEEVVTALVAHRDELGVETGVDPASSARPRGSSPISAAIPLSPHKPVVGSNAQPR
jgi:Isopropylmalate/homocitrate/citramalate synthases